MKLSRVHGTTDERDVVLDALEDEYRALPEPMPGRCRCGARVWLHYKPFCWLDEHGVPCPHPPKSRR